MYGASRHLLYFQRLALFFRIHNGYAKGLQLMPSMGETGCNKIHRITLP
jgi:hypothetical protein